MEVFVKGIQRLTAGFWHCMPRNPDLLTYLDAPQSSSPGNAMHIAPAENDNELEQGQLREDYILAHTANPDAIYFDALWRTKTPEEQARNLRERVKAQGLPPLCLGGGAGALAARATASRGRVD